MISLEAEHAQSTIAAVGAEEKRDLCEEKRVAQMQEQSSGRGLLEELHLTPCKEERFEKLDQYVEHWYEMTEGIWVLAGKHDDRQTSRKN